MSMEPGLRTHKQASLRIAIPTALPVEMWEKMREVRSLKSESHGKGHAKRLMYNVCHEADLAWLTLLIHVEPFDDGMSAEQLEKFYRKFGFEKIQDAPLLIARYPRKLR